jgi:hypothetical protein
MSRTALGACALIGILLVAVIFAPVPGHAVWTERLHDFAHGPIFGCVAVLLLVALRRTQRFATLGVASQYAIAFTCAVTLGFLTEAAQVATGRDASWLDLRNDLIGAASFLALWAAFDPRTRAAPMRRRAAAVLVGLLLLGYLLVPIVQSAVEYARRRSQLPVIADFSRGVDLYFIWPSNVLVDFAPLPAALRAPASESAAHVRFLSASYPGLIFHEPWSDWRGYASLAIELANPAQRPLELAVRVHDAQHNSEYNDRYNKQFTLPAGVREVFRFPIEDIRRAPHGRAMDLANIRGVVVFKPNDSPPDEMFISRLWLE